MRITHRRRALPVAVAAVLAAALMGQPAARTPPDVPSKAPQTTQWQSPPIDAKAPWTPTVSWIVGQMTPQEKVALIAGSWANKMVADQTMDPDTHNQPGYVRGIKRLGVPEVRHADAQGI